MMVRTSFKNERRENPKEVFESETINKRLEGNISTQMGTTGWESCHKGAGRQRKISRICCQMTHMSWNRRRNKNKNVMKNTTISAPLNRTALYTCCGYSNCHQKQGI
jgi:hypothetical protein